MEDTPFYQPRICLVDDDINLREIYIVNLEREGFEVLPAKDGEEGLTRIRTEQPDGIILDLQMPVKSGLDVLRELDTDPKLKTIPVVILSNVDDEEMYKKVGKYNTRFYLVKALTSPEKVIKILREALH
jgi:DNA-binding response OmpR family regulator